MLGKILCWLGIHQEGFKPTKVPYLDRWIDCFRCKRHCPPNGYCLMCFGSDSLMYKRSRVVVTQYQLVVVETYLICDKCGEEIIQ